MYQRTYWENEVRDPANTFTVIDNADGTKTIARAGTRLEEGTPQDKTHFNNMETGISDVHLAERLMAFYVAHAQRSNDAVQETLRLELDALNSDIGVVQTAMGAKNLLEIKADSRTVDGVTFTVDNAAGTVTASGTATASTSINIYPVNTMKLPAGSYILSGCPYGGTSVRYELLISINGTTYRDYGNGVTFSITEDTIVSWIQTVVRNGCTVNNLVFRPMIRLASIADDTFVPYAMTNRELTTEMDALKNKTLLNDAAGQGTKRSYTLERWHSYLMTVQTYGGSGINSTGYAVYLVTCVGQLLNTSGPTIGVVEITKGAGAASYITDRLTIETSGATLNITTAENFYGVVTLCML